MLSVRRKKETYKPILVMRAVMLLNAVEAVLSVRFGLGLGLGIGIGLGLGLIL